VSGPLEAEAEATFDPKLTGIDTPRAQWRLKVNDYEYSPQLYARIMALYFSPEFRAAHLATMADKEELERAVSEQMERGQRALEGMPEPVAAADHTRALQLGAAMALLIVLGGAYLIPRTRISTSEPYTFRIGLRRYTLAWASGTVANYRERETRGIAYIRDANTPIGHEGKRTSFIDNVYEDFTLEGPTGSQPIQVTGKGAQASRLFQAQVGHPLTAIWVTRNGVQRYLRFQLNEGYSVENEHIKTSLAQLFPIPGWTALPALALGYIVGDAMAPFEFSGLVFAMVAFPLWGATFSLLTWQRRRAFERDELEALGKRLAAGTLPTPG